MKFHLLLTVSCALVFLVPCKKLPAQITVTQNDFANAEGTARMTVAVWNPMIDYKTTGADVNWDFSSLQWQSQYIDTFLNPLFTSPMYAFFYNNLPFNPYRSNLAKKADNILTTFPLVSSIFSDGYNFYYKNSTMYRQRGIGMKVSGFPMAVPMTQADTIYKFPMHFDNKDSSWSAYTVQIPQLGTYSHKQHRTNIVDGWGSLLTPFGKFDVLRQVSEIRSSDSLYIDTLKFGFKIDNDIQREYKWIANGQQEPLLQINTQGGIFGLFPKFEFVLKIFYRDSLRTRTTGISNPENNEIQFQVFPNPTGGSFYISIPDNLIPARISITDVSGKIMLEGLMNSSVEQIDAEGWAKGIYILTLQGRTGIVSKKLSIE